MPSASNVRRVEIKPTEMDMAILAYSIAVFRITLFPDFMSKLPVYFGRNVEQPQIRN